MMAALLGVLSPLSIPLSGNVPLSLASLMVMLSGTLLGSKEGTLSVFVYLLCGAFGLPVFAGYGSGMGVLFGVTGGFLMGYLPLAYLSGLFYERKRNFLSLLAGTLAGTSVLYLLGTLRFMALLKTDLEKALASCVLPFLPGDLIKIALTALFTPRLLKITGTQ